MLNLKLILVALLTLSNKSLANQECLKVVVDPNKHHIKSYDESYQILINEMTPWLTGSYQGQFLLGISYTCINVHYVMSQSKNFTDIFLSEFINYFH